MKKVLLISWQLMHYRIPLFNSLCDKIDLTVMHGSKRAEGCLFKQESLSMQKKGPFHVYNLVNLNSYDVVIIPSSVRNLNFLLGKFSRRKYKLGLFGIGVTASLDRGYDKPTYVESRLQKWFMKKSDFSIFYELYPRIKYTSLGISPKKMSIAYNTVAPNPDFDFSEKKFESFIFLGTLYKQKKIFDLLEAYLQLYRQYPNILNLEIIGDGEEYSKIQAFIKENKLENKVILHGKLIHDEDLLPVMNRAVTCISPAQAGLSVQRCFSYGVGFITSYDPITGGEAFSIIESQTGDFYDGTIEDLKRVMLKYLDGHYIKKISSNCYTFYSKYRTIEVWRQGFLKNIV